MATKKSGLFGKAKPAKKAKAKKDDKLIVNVEGKEFAEKLEKFATLKAQMDELKADLAMSQEFVKGVGIEEYAKIVEKEKRNPGSFIMASETGGRVMFLPTKKYIKIGEGDAENLVETYGEDIVNEDTKYAFNTEVLMRNMDTISDLIMNSEDITEDDKENLLEETTTFTVEKETLDKVYTLSKESKMDVSDVLEDIQPVYQVKNAKA